MGFVFRPCVKEDDDEKEEDNANNERVEKEEGGTKKKRKSDVVTGGELSDELDLPMCAGVAGPVGDGVGRTAVNGMCGGVAGRLGRWPGRTTKGVRPAVPHSHGKPDICRVGWQIG